MIIGAYVYKMRDTTLFQSKQGVGKGYLYSTMRCLVLFPILLSLICLPGFKIDIPSNPFPNWQFAIVAKLNVAQIILWFHLFFQ